MDSSSLITIDRSAPPTQTGIATVLRLQPPGDSRGVRWARAGSCFISGKLMPVKNGSLGPNTVVNSNQKINQLIYENPETYDWAIVNAGDLHFCMNTLDAGNKLEYPTIGGFAAEEMESTKEIKATGDAVLEFKHYDRFYQLVTVAAVKTLSDVVPAEFLFHPELLLDHCSANAGSFIFHHFRE